MNFNKICNCRNAELYIFYPLWHVCKASMNSLYMNCITHQRTMATPLNANSFVCLSLQIVDGNSKTDVSNRREPGMFCGESEQPQTFISETSYVKVVFHTDNFTDQVRLHCIRSAKQPLKLPHLIEVYGGLTQFIYTCHENMPPIYHSWVGFLMWINSWNCPNNTLPMPREFG